MPQTHPTSPALLREDPEPLALEILRRYICGLSPGISQAIGGLENGIGRILRVGSLKDSLEGSIDMLGLTERN